ncbi:hypothetical protein [Anaerosporobacter faecicola]|uniref:hypothetical protein n=1 Tax=Anaerosporobacter faecicola TaxID=2718714 RepID=UPI00143AB96F|nr:hypothetical protein [Anaerosporobacter faecicola]
MKKILIVGLLLFTMFIVGCKNNNNSSDTKFSDIILQNGIRCLEKEIEDNGDLFNTDHDEIINDDIETIPVAVSSDNSPGVVANPLLSKNEISVLGKYYNLSYDKKTNEYILYLMDDNGATVKKISHPKIPCVYLRNRSLLQIIYYYGGWYYTTYFYDIDKNIVSQEYNLLVLVTEDKVIYIENRKMIIRDIFDKAKYYKEIKRNFTRTAEPTEAIYKIEFISDHELELHYFSGDNYHRIKEIIDLDNVN